MQRAKDGHLPSLLLSLEGLGALLQQVEGLAIALYIKESVIRNIIGYLLERKGMLLSYSIHSSVISIASFLRSTPSMLILCLLAWSTTYLR